jgi:hypothetical protein
MLQRAQVTQFLLVLNPSWDKSSRMAYSGKLALMISILFQEYGLSNLPRSILLLTS